MIVVGVRSKGKFAICILILHKHKIWTRIYDD